MSSPNPTQPEEEYGSTKLPDDEVDFERELTDEEREFFESIKTDSTK